MACSIDHMNFKYNRDKNSIGIVFYPSSAANFYRKREGNYVWVIRIHNNKAISLNIQPFVNIDWLNLAHRIREKTYLTDATINLIIEKLQQYQLEV